MRIDPAILEPVTARAWRAAEEGEVGGWRLNASGGFSGRINACWPLGSPSLTVEDAIARVEAWYAERSMPARFKLAGGGWIPRDLPERLARAGYAPGLETLVMTGPVNSSPGYPAVSLSETPGPGFLAVFAGTSTDAGDARERLEALERTPAPRAFAVATLDGEAAAIGACAIEAPWAGIFAMRTLAVARRRGLARGVLSALMARAAGHGATTAWLQVEAANSGAVALYEGAGFEEAYRYAYWTNERNMIANRLCFPINY